MESPEPPLHLPLGADAYHRIEAKLSQLSTKIAIWKDRATATGFAD